LVDRLLQIDIVAAAKTASVCFPDPGVAGDAL
jgi:hypothetical protein